MIVCISKHDTWRGKIFGRYDKSRVLSAQKNKGLVTEGQRKYLFVKNSIIPIKNTDKMKQWKWGGEK